jgi:hypothetical protein
LRHRYILNCLIFKIVQCYENPEAIFIFLKVFRCLFQLNGFVRFSGLVISSTTLYFCIDIFEYIVWDLTLFVPLFVTLPFWMRSVYGVVYVQQRTSELNFKLLVHLYLDNALTIFAYYKNKNKFVTFSKKDKKRKTQSFLPLWHRTNWYTSFYFAQ